MAGSNRSRSVNDFDTSRGLRAALRSMGAPADFETVGRDFPNISLAESSNEEDEDILSNPNGELDWVLTNYNAEISQTQSLEEEVKRLQVLKSYLMLDSQREASFERITALASRMFRVRIALVSLVDLGRQWFMSNRGLGDTRETPRQFAFCAHAILSKEDLLVVPDATADHRFKDNPLVTGPPNIRFYAGAPLMCPEGYKLGTLCIIDTKTRPDGLSLEEKQNLRELADLVVASMVERRKEKLRVLQDKSQIIACTAHDLLTPLSGIQMSLSLFEDEEVHKHLTDHQKDLITTANNCANIMKSICHSAINTFRNDVAKHNQEKATANKNDVGGPKTICIADLVRKLYLVMQPFPRKVPVSIEVDSNVPPFIVGDDLKIFRSAINYLTNACAKTEEGSIELHISVTGEKKQQLLFECEDTGPGVPYEMYEYLFRPFREEEELNEELNESCISLDGAGNVSRDVCRSAMKNSGLGLYSVANQISSIGGEYGFRPGHCVKEETSKVFNGINGVKAKTSENGSGIGAVFWFSIPLQVPQDEPTPMLSPQGPHTVQLSPSRHGHSRSNSDASAAQVHSRRNSNESAASLSILMPAEDVSVPSPDRSERNPHILLEHSQKIAQKMEMLTSPTDTAVEERVTSMEALSLPSTPAVETRTTHTEAPATLKSDEADSNEMPPNGASRVRKALVIDDSVIIRKSLDRALRKQGFDVKLATNGLEGLEELQTEVFDVVFCDFLMPIMDGLDCVKQYRDWEAIHRPWFRQYIIGISAHADVKDVEKGKLSGMDDFHSKPVPLKTIQQMVESEEVKQASKKLDDALLSKPAPDVSDKDLAKKEDSPKWVKDSTKMVCLVAESSSTIRDVMVETLEEHGCKSVIASDGEDALRLLKTRNWTAVFLAEELPRLTGIRCMERFRDWEQDHRVCRQANTILVSDRAVPSPDRNVRHFKHSQPPGFDSVLGKPILRTDLVDLIAVATRLARNRSGSCSSMDILSRSL